jgi:chromosome segregation ATPase
LEDQMSVPLNMDPVSGHVYDDQFPGMDDVLDQRPAEFTRAEALAELVQDLAALQRRNEHLEAMQSRAEKVQADQAQLIDELTQSLRIMREHRAELVNELAGARVIIEARDSRVVQLEEALERRNGQMADATEAAEAYRAERNAARATIDAVARLIDPES